MHSARGTFVPPHCPFADCESHRVPGPWRAIRKGFFVRATAPRVIQRYRCPRCGRSFSSQTFSLSYWLRRPEILTPLFLRLLSCSALRQISAEFGASHSTIARQAARLGRHCLLLHEHLRPRAAPAEPLVLDGFRSFESGQYWPFELNLLIGVSHYLYGFQDAELRRSGRMRESQRRRRASLERRFGRPTPGATRRAVAELVARIVPPGGSALIRSDEHADYPIALRSLAGRIIVHERTSSTRPRTPRNPLFAANLADLLLRHTGANHKRETIAFSKRRQGALYRAAIFLVWRNYLKSRSERRRDAPPGVAVGAIRQRLTPQDVLRTRIFPWRIDLTGWLERCYLARIPTRCLPHARYHDLRYAI
jgi:transposase-like protein